jgi:hypothetical protein
MPSACQRGHAGDFGPGLKGLGPGGSILIGGNVVAAVGLRAACLLLVDLGASLGVKLGGRTIAKRSIACLRCPSLRVARAEAVRPPSGLLYVRRVSARGSSSGQSAPGRASGTTAGGKPSHMGRTVKLSSKGALTYIPGRDRDPHRLCPLLHRGKTLSPALLVNGKPAQLLEEPQVCLTEIVAHHLKRVAVHLGQPRTLLLQPGNRPCRS